MLQRIKNIIFQKKRKRKTGAGDFIVILKTRGFLKRTAVLVKDMLKTLRFKHLSVYLRIGLDDAADTGLIFSVLSPVVSLLDYFSDCSVRLEPSFVDEAVFEGYFNGTVRLQPIRLVPPFSRFVFSRPTFRVVKKVFLSRWRKRK